jgi:probable H4MPT-linked C1 transfer pathway protein
MAERVLAFDVGGAAIKAADGEGWTAAERFELWRDPDGLAAALGRIAHSRRPHRIVATMTGEIADCYPSRAAGVARIVEAASAAAAEAGCELGIYLVDGSIVPPSQAIERPLAAAASNWHALARLAARHATADTALLIDVGSTTTDVIPIEDGRPAPAATDDVGRMRSGELVYTGVERTPIAAIVRSLPWRGSRRAVVSERYADSRDAWLLLGDLPEEPGDLGTADGRPATKEHARGRLARMILVDPGDFTLDDAVFAAASFAEAQARKVAIGLRRATQGRPRPEAIVLSGHGPYLARRALKLAGLHGSIVSLDEKLGPAISRVAPAHAVALITAGAIR